MKRDTDILDTLRAAKTDLAAKTSLERTAYTAHVSAMNRHDSATKSRLAAQARYDTARKAAAEAFPESFKL